MTTLMVVCVSISMMHAEALNEPTRAAARPAVTLAPVLVETTPELKAPMRALRNIFAPLPKAAPVVELEKETATETPLRLAAMVDDVVFQESLGTFTEKEKEHFDTLLASAFSKFPAQYTAPLERLTFKKSRTGSRGLSGANVMILRTLGMTDQELVAVSIHELGHIIDMGALKGTRTAGPSGFMDGKQTVYADDPSVAFYRISWETDLLKRGTAADFVSGYAMNDPFEDFSETFAMYVLHGERFRKLARSNDALALKYAYMRQMFEGQEFYGIDAIPTRTSVEDRPWDVTLQPYSWAAFEQARFVL